MVDVPEEMTRGPNSWPSGARGFVGRLDELDTFARCARQAEQGQASVVTIEGAGGIGKSVLLRQALSTYAGFNVWWAACDAIEQEWPFGLFGQWMRRAASHRLRNLPLLTTLTPIASPLQVGRELLELVGEMQDEQPLALVIDDVPLADPESLQAIGFMMRRLWADRVW